MIFPKKDALQMAFRTQEDALQWATKKRKFGGCFETYHNLFIVYWLPTNHPMINEFSW
jgi:hypothetical protein